MAIINIFKKKKAEKEKIKKKEKKAESEKEEKSAEEKSTEVKKRYYFGQSYRIIKGPHVTEKMTDLTEKNQYVFKVWPRANKIDIKKAINEIFGVDVLDVKIIRVKGKKIRLGKIEGKKPGYKKAVVKIKKGQKIELLSR